MHLTNPERQAESVTLPTAPLTMELMRPAEIRTLSTSEDVSDTNLNPKMELTRPAESRCRVGYGSIINKNDGR